jgi:hypothetical protein
MFSPSLRRDQVLNLLKVGLEADEDDDVASDLESETVNPVLGELLDPQVIARDTLYGSPAFARTENRKFLKKSANFDRRMPESL